MINAYAAGIVDGEGCIMITKVGVSYAPLVTVSNTNFELMEELHKTYGGKIYKISKPKNKLHWKDSWQWRIHWSYAVDFLKEIYPFLIIKKKQADLVFE